jgi:hypothetical protein
MEVGGIPPGRHVASRRVARSYNEEGTLIERYREEELEGCWFKSSLRSPIAGSELQPNSSCRAVLSYHWIDARRQE